MEQTNPLITAVVSAFDAYILALVDKRVAEILQTQASLNAINEETTSRIETLINDAIEEHEAREDHPAGDAITQEIDQALSDFDFDDKIREAVRNLSFTVEVD
jgi:hypothetical protein